MIEAVVLHPPVFEFFAGAEHAEGELEYIGDALGVDVVVKRWIDGWTRDYENDGARNEDWYGWNVALLAPMASTIEKVRINPETNTPGTMGKPPASAIQFLGDDGVRVTYGHVQDVRVAEGARVVAGDVVALIGNNGMCWHPHVHIGAWRDDTPLQIRFDLAALGRLRRDRNFYDGLM
ncbi:MAG: hypothetical protein QOK28_1237 [Actinomycetota bacterium]